VAGKIVGDIQFILVRELYKSGAPLAVSVRREMPIEDGFLRVVVTPAVDSVIAVALIKDRFGHETIHERTTGTVWADWNFNSRRVWVRCSVCTEPCDKLFVSAGPLAGSLICGRCANVRYASQDQDPVERLHARLIKIVERLGGEVGDEAIPAFPRRPKGMHLTTYERLTSAFRARAILRLWLSASCPAAVGDCLGWRSVEPNLSSVDATAARVDEHVFECSAQAE
jgi:hypothetical protein